MAVTGHIFPQFMAGVTAASAPLNMNGGTWKIALGNAAGPITLATTNVSTAKTFSDWTAIVAEITGTGYTAGGVTVASPTWSVGGTNNAVMTFTSGTTPTWTTATFSANQAVLYMFSGTTWQLACFWDFGASVPVTASTFTLTINGSGLLTATAS